jgi:hypothetical protein
MYVLSLTLVFMCPTRLDAPRRLGGCARSCAYPYIVWACLCSLHVLVCAFLCVHVRRETLDDAPRRLGFDVRDRLLQFYRENYSAERMTLCIAGKVRCCRHYYRRYHCYSHRSITCDHILKCSGSSPLSSALLNFVDQL